MGTNVIEEVKRGTLNHSHSLSVLVLSNNFGSRRTDWHRAWIQSSVSTAGKPWH